MWEKEKNLSTHEELNLRPSDSVFHFSSTEPQRMVSEVYYKVHMTCFQHTARISNVNSVKFVNRIKETKWRKMFFVLSQVWVKEENVSSHKESNLRPSEIPHSVALSLSHTDSMVSKVYYEVL